MKSTFLFLTFSLPFICFSQHSLSGRIEDAKTGEPLPFATIYIDKTTNGTSSDTQGNFRLNFSLDNPTIVLTFVGYQTIIYELGQEADLSKRFVFKMEPDIHLLEGINVTDERDEEWYANLKVFKQNFLGTSKNAQSCTILNEEKLIIDFSNTERLLKVWANEPLIVENFNLGYRIEYSLNTFTYDLVTGLINFSGYVFYRPLQGRSGKQKKWAKNRDLAYLGSSAHFLKSMVDQHLDEEGFVLRRLQRKRNPNYPTDEELAIQREQMRSSGVIVVSGSSTRIPKIIEVLDTSQVPVEEYLTKTANGWQLQFDNHFQVVYNKEKEADEYLQLNPFSTRKPAFQTSLMSLTVDMCELNDSGHPLHPFDILYEGYWAYEKLGDMVPLDYQPISNDN